MQGTRWEICNETQDCIARTEHFRQIVSRLQSLQGRRLFTMESFDPDYYLASNADVQRAGVDPLDQDRKSVV